MATEGSIWLAGVEYPFLADAALPSGRRGIVRQTRDARGGDPSRLRTARWKLSGPLGLSRETPDGFLGHDYSDNLDTLYEPLLTSPAARNALTLTGLDPPTTAGVVYGSTNFGAGVFGPTYVAADVDHADEDRGQLYFHRGRVSTQVNPSTPSVVQSVVHDAAVEGADVWRGNGYIGLGNTSPMKRRVRVGTASSSYEEVTIGPDAIYTRDLTRGTDRLWMIRGDAALIRVNEVRYSLDQLDSISNSFVVGDPGIPSTGIGTFGHVGVSGSEVGAFSYTDRGKPVSVLEDVRGQPSTNNGRHFVSKWGWLYITTDVGLYAVIPGQVENPAGPETLRGFEGPIDGRPTALWQYKSSLWVAYLTTLGHTYVLRGEFGSETAATGRPDWFPFRRLASTEVKLIFSTGQRTNPSLWFGEDSNSSHYILGRRGRDIDDANYVFSTDNGTWFGSTLMRDQQTLKNVRYGKFVTENCFPGSTVVRWNGDLEKVYRRHYDGDLIEVVTRSGQKLSGTPNHPVAARGGWVPMGELVEGDYLLHDRRSVERNAIKADPQHREPRIDEVFRLAQSLGIVERKPGRSMDFHGDGTDEQVDVVSVDGVLGDRFQAVLSGYGFDQPLPDTDEPLPFLAGASGLSQPLRASRTTTDSRVSLQRPLFSHGGPLALGPSYASPRPRAQLHTAPLQPAPYCAGRNPVSPPQLSQGDSAYIRPDDIGSARRLPAGEPGAFNPLGFSKGAKDNARIAQYAAGGGATNAVLASNTTDTGPTLVERDEIIEIRRTPFSGHVYNLQTSDHQYSANGLRVHNCDANNTWRLAVSLDEGSFINVGAAVTANGQQTVRPTTGSPPTPLTTVSGHSIKPRLTQVAASSSAPPQIRGMLEIGYDERPDVVEEVQAILHLGQRGQLASTDYDALVALADRGVSSPSTVRLPEDEADSFGFVTNVGEFTDIKGDRNMSALVTIVLWETS